MKWKTSFALATVVVALFSMVAVETMKTQPVTVTERRIIPSITETPICTDPKFQYNPAVYGDIIVWDDLRNNNYDIYMYNLLTGTETPICTASDNQVGPVVYGDIIVWSDLRGPLERSYDIYMYNLSSETETPITTALGKQLVFSIWGMQGRARTIVWQEGHIDIYMYNLTDKTEHPICTAPGTQNNPAVCGDIIVWDDLRNNNYDIYMYNLSTGIETPICTESDAQYAPAVYGDIIVWADQRNGMLNGDIYMYNISDGTENPVCTDPANQRIPAIHGNRIVWEDDRNGNWDIYMYDLSTGFETQITTNSEIQRRPAIYGDRIVWEDGRNGNWDIYLGELYFPPPPESPTEQVEEIMSIVEDPSQIPVGDFDGANDEVRDNRRNTLMNRLGAVIRDIQTAEASSDPSIINTAYQRAIDQLYSILDKTDGCAERGSPDPPGTPGETADWITTCESQAQIDPLIRDLITTLEDLLIPLNK